MFQSTMNTNYDPNNTSKKQENSLITTAILLQKSALHINNAKSDPITISIFNSTTLENAKTKTSNKRKKRK